MAFTYLFLVLFRKSGQCSISTRSLSIHFISRIVSYFLAVLINSQVKLVLIYIEISVMLVFCSYISITC